MPKHLKYIKRTYSAFFNKSPVKVSSLWTPFATNPPQRKKAVVVFVLTCFGENKIQAAFSPCIVPHMCGEKIFRTEESYFRELFPLLCPFSTQRSHKVAYIFISILTWFTDFYHHWFIEVLCHFMTAMANDTVMLSLTFSVWKKTVKKWKGYW